MNKILLTILILGAFLAAEAPGAKAQAPAAAPAASAAPAGAPAPAGGRKKRVAVFDFDFGTVQSASNAAFGQNIDVGKGISDLLVKYLVQDGTYSVIERKALDKILAEQNFSNSDRANPASAAKLGKLLGVDAIIVGSVTQFGNDTKKTNVGGGGAPAGHPPDCGRALLVGHGQAGRAGGPHPPAGQRGGYRPRDLGGPFPHEGPRRVAVGPLPLWPGPRRPVPEPAASPGRCRADACLAAGPRARPPGRPRVGPPPRRPVGLSDPPDSRPRVARRQHLRSLSNLSVLQNQQVLRNTTTVAC